MIKLLKYMKGYGRECILGPLFKLFEALIELFIPYVVLNLINKGVKTNDLSYVNSCVLLLIGMGLVGLLLSITAQYFSAKAAVGFTARVREVLFKHIMKLSYSDIDRIGKSTLINRITSDMNQVQTGINLTLRLFLRSPFIVFGSMIMAFTIDFNAAMIFVVTIPLLSIVVFSIMLISIPLYKKVQSNLDVITSKTRENLNGVRMLRALNKEDSEISEFKSANERLNKSQRFVGSISALMNPLTFVIINLAIVFLIYKGMLSVSYGILSQAAVIALYNYMSSILVELIKLANLIISITKSFACGNRVQSVLEIVPSINDDSTGDIDNLSCENEIEFKNVSFSYFKGGRPSINNVSFALKRGETLGIIGGTGSGKTTLINLLCRFYEADDGEIYVFGKNIKSQKRSDILSKIGIVSQKSQLFEGSVKSNVLFGNENATDEDINFALECSMSEEFVSKLDKEIDSTVEQFGRNLSGGQKQRLTIARAIVKKPQIIILDDSSSALDYLTDRRLRENLKNLPNNPTVIIVSQRCSAIADADKIIVLDEGCIMGIGTHEELINSCETYSEFFLSQNADKEGT